MKRVGTTRQAADHFGFHHDDGRVNVRAFLSWAADAGINPIAGKKHHLWWDFKAIEQFLDKESTVKQPAWNDIISKGLSGGKGISAVPD